MKGFEVTNWDAINVVKDKLQGSIRCAILYMMLYGQLKREANFKKDSYSFMRLASRVFETWKQYCFNIDPVFNRFFKSGLVRLSELVLNTVAEKSPRRAINGKKLYQLVFLISEILNTHIVDEMGKDLYLY
uniref:Transposase n=1 Tax=Mesocestoides corti TaxID=53468 RepID=A0A5K3F3I9_MESCO